MTTPLQTSMPLNAATPSFFELFVADRLQRSLAPALEHFVRTAVTVVSTQPGGVAARALATLKFALRFHDEAELLAIGVLQYWSLWNHGAPCVIIPLGGYFLFIVGSTPLNLTPRIFQMPSSASGSTACGGCLKAVPGAMRCAWVSTTRKLHSRGK